MMTRLGLPLSILLGGLLISSTALADGQDAEGAQLGAGQLAAGAAVNVMRVSSNFTRLTFVPSIYYGISPDFEVEANVGLDNYRFKNDSKNNIWVRLGGHYLLNLGPASLRAGFGVAIDPSNDGFNPKTVLAIDLDLKLDFKLSDQLYITTGAGRGGVGNVVGAILGTPSPEHFAVIDHVDGETLYMFNFDAGVGFKISPSMSVEATIPLATTLHYAATSSVNGTTVTVTDTETVNFGSDFYGASFALIYHLANIDVSAEAWLIKGANSDPGRDDSLYGVSGSARMRF